MVDKTVVKVFPTKVSPPAVALTSKISTSIVRRDIESSSTQVENKNIPLARSLDHT